jgi:hypothetical protein
MTDEEKLREIENIKNRLRIHLNEFSQLRKVVLRDTELISPERVEVLFKFADQMSDLILSGFDIDHPMMPDIITCLVAIVSGISKGIGTDELKSFLKFQEQMGGTGTNGVMH